MTGLPAYYVLNKTIDMQSINELDFRLRLGEPVVVYVDELAGLNPQYVLRLARSACVVWSPRALEQIWGAPEWQCAIPTPRNSGRKSLFGVAG